MRHITMRFTALAAVALVLCAVLPVTAGAAPRFSKHVNPDGSVPAKWDLPTPVLPSDDTTPEAAGGDGDGSNTISFKYFDDGDILCAFPGSTLTGHTGVWKDSLYVNSLSKCVWSANTTPVDGVQLEPACKYWTYDCCYGLWVPSHYTYGSDVTVYCKAQLGEPYDITSSKTDFTRWYCSKLAWAAWKYKAGPDLDANGGYWVTPADLVNDLQTCTFVFSD